MTVNPVIFIIVSGLFVGMLFLMEIGRRIGLYRFTPDPQVSHVRVGIIEIVVFTLFVLIIAFLFFSATSRLETSRRLITEEANAISTAYFRLDLLNVQNRDALRKDLRKYLETRLEAYRRLPDLQEAIQVWDKANQLQTQLWRRAVSSCRQEDSQTTTRLILPEISRMTDLGNYRYLSLKIQPPVLPNMALGIIALFSALVAGRCMSFMKRTVWINSIILAAIIAVIIYVILDIDYPRMGLIQAHSAETVLSELLKNLD